MKDKIKIENLEVYAYHGVYPEENIKGQRFYINAVLELDTRKAAGGDDLTLTADYGAVAHFIHDYLRKDTYKLLETAVNRLAEAILMQFPLLTGAELDISKPEAPIGLELTSVAVKIARRWKKTAIAVGANLGEPVQAITGAVAQIKNHPKIRSVRLSKILKSAPYGGVEQPDFINAAMIFETLLSPAELLTFLQEQERRAERVTDLRWGPRTLDLDILLYEDVISDRPELMIPHPDMHNRDFVLQPLAQLSPYLLHPLLNKTVSMLLNELEERYVLGVSGDESIKADRSVSDDESIKADRSVSGDESIKADRSR